MNSNSMFNIKSLNSAAAAADWIWELAIESWIFFIVSLWFCRMKQINVLGIPCFIVIALDDELYNFLHNWQPDHVIRAPPGFAPVVPRQYAVQGSGAMKHLSRVRIAALEAITDQVSTVPNLFKKYP